MPTRWRDRIGSRPVRRTPGAICGREVRSVAVGRGARLACGRSRRLVEYCAGGWVKPEVSSSTRASTEPLSWSAGTLPGQLNCRHIPQGISNRSATNPSGRVYRIAPGLGTDGTEFFRIPVPPSRMPSTNLRRDGCRRGRANGHRDVVCEGFVSDRAVHSRRGDRCDWATVADGRSFIPASTLPSRECLPRHCRRSEAPDVEDSARSTARRKLARMGTLLPDGDAYFPYFSQ